VSELLQPVAILRNSSGEPGGAALRAVSTDLQPADHDVEAAIALDLALQAVEKIALELHYFAASQASHVDVIPLWPAFVVMLLPLHVHQVEFVYQPLALEQIERAINRDPVDVRVDFARAAKNLAGVQMLLRRFYHA